MTLSPRSSPLLIGATGGSGTRLIKALLEPHLFGGLRVNEAGDALDFVAFYNKHVGLTLRVTRSLNYALRALPRDVTDPALNDLRQALSVFCADLPTAQQPWMIKNPRSMYMLPYFSSIFAELRFLHVLRDGRDMAISTNQNQLTSHYQDLFDEPVGSDQSVASARLWNKANCDVAEWAESHLHQRYKRVRYEDVCRSPAVIANEIFAWLDLPSRNCGSAALSHVVHAQPEIGRWRQLPAQRLAEISSACCLGLDRFGYAIDELLPAP